ncbi:hypothetical protein E6W39_20315 [Kitasatospora acidiphila]|uniref:Uncharacterized protein n=1 Tax=Kitasatospora acidiphila TaxID=2567942 RepID=A0A540W581_9ACTN|nr:hypothetical protein [Kitasatospora acidiphila]TQF04143.1 hypothetical protein E6W39_20315 [Kitasatospora acidiphila]
MSTPDEGVAAAGGAEAAPRRVPRGVAVALATLGLLAVTAASATVTVAVGRPDHPHRAAVAAVAAVAAATTGPSTGAATSGGPTPLPVPVPLPSITLAPEPGSTLHGTVDGGTHGGDLRYFLLPVPDGAEPYGSPDGTALTVDDLAAQYAQSTGIKSVLDSYGYQEAVSRRYRTADGKAEVESRLMRFATQGNAQGFANGASFANGSPIDVPGDSTAKGYVFKPDQQAFTGRLVGVSTVGDVEYEVTVDVKGDPDQGLLADAMKRQRDRLSHGG